MFVFVPLYAFVHFNSYHAAMPSADPEAADASSHSAGGARMTLPTYSDRMLAEAVAALECRSHESIDDTEANARAQLVDGDLEQRIITRAGSLPVASSLHAAIHHMYAALGWIIAIAVIGVIFAGAATARAVLGSPSTAEFREPINIFLALLSILGLQTLILLLWLSVVVVLPRMMKSRGAACTNENQSSDRATLALGIASFGGIVVKITQRVAAWIHKGPVHAAAIMAVGGVNTRGSLGKWTLSAISHGLWLSFNVGCLIMVIVLLSTRQYTFAWETTILSEHAFVPLTRAVAALPEMVGFTVPTPEQIEHSQWPGSTANPYVGKDSSQAWASLLVGAIVVYGFAPRLMLLGFSLGKRRMARRRFQVDTSAPQFMRLERILMPVARLIGVVDGDEPTHDASRQTSTLARSSRPISSAAMLGLEFLHRSSAWPPRVNNAVVSDLGMIEGGNDQRRIIQQLKSSSSEPRVLIVVVSLTTTPDRGIASFMRGLREVITTPIAMILTGGHAFRQRGNIDQVVQRINDWRLLAVSVGIDDSRILEIDLDHLTDVSAAPIAAIISGNEVVSRISLSRRIEPAFALIIENARHWGDSVSPDLAQRSDLHRQIAKLYQHEHSSWRELLRLPSALRGDIPGQLRSSAGRMIDLLPPRLRKSSRWLAAGAASGALACVAAATLISPIAIASLPMWSAIGAAIGAMAQPSGTAKSSEGAGASSSDLGDAVRAAALFALLLELQGRNEASITRILDRVIDDSHERAMSWIADVRIWLDDVRHRLDMALARETSA